MMTNAGIMDEVPLFEAILVHSPFLRVRGEKRRHCAQNIVTFFAMVNIYLKIIA